MWVRSLCHTYLPSFKKFPVCRKFFQQCFYLVFVVHSNGVLSVFVCIVCIHVSLYAWVYRPVFISNSIQAAHCFFCCHLSTEKKENKFAVIKFRESPSTLSSQWHDNCNKISWTSSCWSSAIIDSDAVNLVCMKWHCSFVADHSLCNE